MKTYISDIFNRAHQFSDKLDAKAVLCNRSWLVFNDEGEKETYIFKRNGDMMIVKSGVVTDGTWEMLSFNQSIIIRANDQKIMVRPSYVDKELMALQVDGTNRYAFLIDEQYKEDFIRKTYLEVIDYIEAKSIESKKEEDAVKEEQKKKEDPIEFAKKKAEDIVIRWEQYLLVYEILLGFIVLFIMLLNIDDGGYKVLVILSTSILILIFHKIDNLLFKNNYINKHIRKYISEHPGDIVNQFLKEYIK